MEYYFSINDYIFNILYCFHEAKPHRRPKILRLQALCHPNQQYGPHLAGRLAGHRPCH